MFRHPDISKCATFINDIPRNQWYQQNIADNVKGKVVFEIGCGVGLLAAYALQAGAKHYYGIDIISSRVSIAKKILTDLGYEKSCTLWTADFLSLTHEDIPTDIDVLLCERIGDQLQNNLKLNKFWNHANQLFRPDYVAIPDAWSIGVHVYEGIINNFKDYLPTKILNSDSLPTGFKEALESLDFVKPSQTHKQAITITPSDPTQSVKFDLDLRGYKSATIVITDDIYYNNTVCNTVSALVDWSRPTTLEIPEANGIITVYWDETNRNLPNFRNGYWSYKKNNG